LFHSHHLHLPRLLPLFHRQDCHRLHQAHLFEFCARNAQSLVSFLPSRVFVNDPCGYQAKHWRGKR
jgi:hypothetical protein